MRKDVQILERPRGKVKYRGACKHTPYDCAGEKPLLTFAAVPDILSPLSGYTSVQVSTGRCCFDAG